MSVRVRSTLQSVETDVGSSQVEIRVSGPKACIVFNGLACCASNAEVSVRIRIRARFHE